MDDREKVINKVTAIVADMQEEVDEWRDYSDSELRGGLTCDCDWWYKMLQGLNDTLALLKAQEPIEPKVWEGERIIPDSIHAGYSYAVTDVFYDCGKCGVNLWRGQSNQFIQFCKHCGQAVKWDG